MKRSYDASSSKKSKKTKRRRTGATLGDSAHLRKSEIKAVDYPDTDCAFDQSGTRLVLNAVVPGTAQWNRIGRRIVMKSLQVTMNLNLTDTAAAAQQYDHLRAAIIYDRSPNGNAPVWSDVFQSVSAAGAANNTVNAFQNLSNSDRFKIIRDYHWKLGPYDTQAPDISRDLSKEVTGHKSNPQVCEYIRLGDLPTQYNTGSAGTIADISSGALYLFTLGYNSSANNYAALKVVARLRYTDA